MPLTSVTLVLHSKLANRAPDIVTTIASDFLLPDLTLAQACQLAPVGSTSLLDLVWLRSLRDAKTTKWTAAKLLQSEPHYNRWQFSQAMLQTVRRGDLVTLQWLLTHFSGCPVSSEVVEEAARGGHLWVLQLLEADRTHGGIEWSDRSVDEAARSGKWELVRWLLRRTRSTREAGRADDDVVNCAFEQNNLVEVKWAIERRFRVRSITFPDCVEAGWQGRAEILRYLLDGSHVPVANIGGIAAYRAARFGDLDFIKWLASKYKELIDVQYWAHAAENASEGGHLSVVQWVFVNVGGIVRGNGPSVAMFAAAENGKVDVVEWLYKQYGSKLNVELFQELTVPSDAGDDEEEDMIPTTAMDAAARNGHLCVLKVLNGIDAVSRNKQRKRGGTSKRTQVRQEGHYPRCTSFAMDAAAAGGHLNVVKWLHSHRTEGCTIAAMDRAADNGHLEVMQWLHSHRSEGCTTAAMDNAAKRRYHVETCEGSRCDLCCLNLTPTSFHEKQLEIIQWLHMNRTEGCTTAAMDGAVANGNLTLLQWLRDNTAGGCSPKSMVSAARLGRLDIIKWLQKYYTEAFTRKAMPKAASRGHLNVVKWLCMDQVADEALQKAASRGHLHVVRWLLPYCSNPNALLSAMKLAHSREHFEVMLLLDAQLGSHYDGNVLREMRCHWLKYRDIQHWFNEKYPPPPEHVDRAVLSAV